MKDVTIDLRNEELQALSAYADGYYNLNIQGYNFKLNEDDYLKIHNMITNTLQEKFIN